MDATKTRILKRDRERLVGFYKDAFRDIADSIVSNTVTRSQRPRFAKLLQETASILGKLDSESTKWVKAEIGGIYKGNLRWLDKELRVRGVPKSALKKVANYAQIHEDAIKQLILSPTEGLGPRLESISSQVGQTVRQYVTRHRTILRQSRLINQEVSLGILTGRSSAETRDSILRALSGKRPRSVLGLSRSNPYSTILDSPYIKIPLSAGGDRSVHIFDYVNLLAVTKESEARTVARNNRALENGIDLVQVTPNPPLTPDACSLYAGRIFSLTDAAHQRTGYPTLSSTPRGGPPFHPFCTHSTIPVVIELLDKDTILEMTKNGDGSTRSRRGVPVGALNVSFSRAQEFFKSKGGMPWAARQNPQLFDQSVSSYADKKVREALRR